VSYKTRDGKEDWTPVVRRRRKGRRHVSGNSESDSDGSKVDVSCSRLVRYEVRVKHLDLLFAAEDLLFGYRSKLWQ